MAKQEKVYWPESEETNIVGKKDATCTEDGYTGDVVYACCGAVKEKGTAIKSNGKHTYTELIPEYKISEIVVTTDENGNSVTSNVAYVKVVHLYREYSAHKGGGTIYIDMVRLFTGK